MSPRLLKWKPIPGKSIHGRDIEIPYPDLLDSSSSWTILERILKMEQKRPIPFAEAVMMSWEKHQEAIDARRLGYAPGECLWYARNFTDWISSLGYHIELTGDEFELHQSGVPST